jgi:predicted RNase H-like HicB family nuclease
LPAAIEQLRLRAGTQPEIREAIAFHIDGMRQDGLPIPQPTSTVEYVELAA